MRWLGQFRSSGKTPRIQCSSKKASASTTGTSGTKGAHKSPASGRTRQALVPCPARSLVGNSLGDVCPWFWCCGRFQRRSNWKLWANCTPQTWLCLQRRSEWWHLLGCRNIHVTVQTECLRFKRTLIIVVRQIGNKHKWELPGWVHSYDPHGYRSCDLRQRAVLELWVSDKSGFSSALASSIWLVWDHHWLLPGKKISGKRTKVNADIHLVKSGKQESPIRWGVDELRWQLINFRHSVFLLFHCGAGGFQSRESASSQDCFSWGGKPWPIFFLETTGCPYRFPRWLSGKESTCQCKRPRFDPGLGRSPEEEMVTPSGILAWKIPWTEEPRQVTARGVARSQTWLSTHRVLEPFLPCQWTDQYWNREFCLWSLPNTTLLDKSLSSEGAGYLHRPKQETRVVQWPKKGKQNVTYHWKEKY